VISKEDAAALLSIGAKQNRLMRELLADIITLHIRLEKVAEFADALDEVADGNEHRLGMQPRVTVAAFSQKMHNIARHLRERIGGEDIEEEAS
jgi:hypothetical protein